MKLDWPPPEFGRLTAATISQLHHKREESVTLQFEHATVSYEGMPAAQLARTIRTFIAAQHASIGRFPLRIEYEDPHS